MNQRTVVCYLSVVWLALTLVNCVYSVTPSKSTSKFEMISVVCTSDSDVSSGTVSVVTSDDHFARIQISPTAKISKGSTPFSFAEITSDYEIKCKGTWDKKAFPITFNAEYVFISKKLDGFAVQERVAAACRKISKDNQGKPLSSGKTGPRTVESRVPEQKPQIEVLECDWVNHEPKAASHVSVSIRNLTEYALADLEVVVKLYTKDGKYVTSSVPNPSLVPRVSPGGKSYFNVFTQWTPGDYPEVHKYSLEFICSNHGKLKMRPQDEGLRDK